MASRKYRRNKNGQFASSGGTVTMGKAGGFANAAHRSAVQARKVRKARNKRILKVVAKGAGTAAAAGLGAAIAGRGARKAGALAGATTAASAIIRTLH